jgi:porphyrinogen peroxidase
VGGDARGRAGAGDRQEEDSEELDPRRADSHVAKTDQDRFGKILRRNMPFGTVSQHGTMFVGFSSDQLPLQTMLERAWSACPTAREMP